MMNLNPELLNRIFNALDSLIENYGAYLYLVFVWLALAIIAWIISGALRRRMKGNPPTIISIVIIMAQPPNQPKSPIIDIEVEQTRDDGDEIMDLTMTTFYSQQPDRRQCVHQKANASAFQVHATNYAVKLHVHIHAARKIGCSSLSNVVQAHIIEFSFYWNQALPLVRTRILRLANSSPKIVQNPARRLRDVHEPSGKKSGEMPRVISTQRLGNGKAMPPNVRQDDL